MIRPIAYGSHYEYQIIHFNVFLIIFRYIYIPSRHFPSTPSSSDGACHTHPWWNHNFLARKSSWKCLLLWWQGTSMFYLPGVLFDCLCWWGELFCDWRPGPIFRDTNSQWVAQRQLEARPRVTERGEGGARPVITHPISCIYHFCLEIFVYIIMNEKLNLDKRIKMLLLWHKWIITWLWLFSGSFYLLHNVWHFD